MPKGRSPTPLVWARIRSELGATPAVAVVPKDNLLLGRQAIMEYLHIREDRIMDRWIDEYALPVIKRPDGYWMSTITSIDQWILLAAKVAYGKKQAEGRTTTQLREARREKRARIQQSGVQSST